MGEREKKKYAANRKELMEIKILIEELEDKSWDLPENRAERQET